ncbi:hypothetical protein AKJ40_02265 [candidate division MSBL1 archaeon SCGC-AAA259M10]|uniref:Uroporphyrinogen decarboxylase (URO-D) domain-containing protein n=2 Tax=candidate division MSBL1 TaxID=215777 RepID=A0A133V0E4_9EURY|nr:hypothetical protein AKJ40_02265 [candidate division MSBL1 archaeon SCGC-AAA259M10]
MRFLNRREMILKTFGEEDPGGVVWQPRIENWYDVNKAQGDLPERYQNMDLLEVYDDLDASPRPYLIPYPSPEDLRGEEGWGGFCPQYAPPVIKIKSKGNVEGEIRKEEGEIIERWDTPKGRLTRRWKPPQTSISARVHEYPIKDIEDLDTLEYILEDQQWEFDLDAWKEVKNRIGDRAPIAAIAGRAPLQELHMFFMPYEKAINRLLKSNPKKVKNFLKKALELKSEAFDTLAESPVELICLADNLDGRLLGPSLFEEHILPYYQRYAPELKDVGKLIYAHWDGSLRGILNYAQDTKLHGLEALTPKPQGDVTLEEIKEALGDNMVLLDGVPAQLFMPNESEKALEKTVKKILNMFYPNIVLGISDELPPKANIERVKLVSEIVRDWNKKR